MKYLIVLFLAMVQTLSAQSDTTIAPHLVKVHVIAGTNRHRIPYDGDGAKVRFENGKVIKVRWGDLNAPEMKNTSFWNGCDTMQPYAIESRDFLASLIKDQDIYIDTLPFKGKRARWSYDRMICDAYFLDSTSVAETLLLNGTVWFTPSTKLKRVNEGINERFALLQEYAIKNKKGLHGLKRKQVLPSTWKRLHPNKR